MQELLLHPKLLVTVMQSNGVAEFWTKKPTRSTTTSACPLGPLYRTVKSCTPSPVRCPQGITVVFASVCPAAKFRALDCGKVPCPPQMTRLPAAVGLTAVTVAMAALG